MEGEINESLIHLKRNGFINYFGMQRFGNSTSVSTQAVGKQLILGNWKEAVHLLLDPRDDDPEGSILTARTAWKNGDLKAALDGLPSSCTSERALLRYFLKQESGNIRNFSNALSQIPRNLRLMYVHAYQSYVWNMAASERIRRQGIAVLPGDLVVVASVDESKIGKDKVCDIWSGQIYVEWVDCNCKNPRGGRTVHASGCRPPNARIRCALS